MTNTPIKIGRHLAPGQRDEMDRRLLAGDTAAAVSVALGIGPTTVQGRARVLRAEGRLKIPAVSGLQSTPAAQDVVFWRQKAAEQTKRAVAAEKIADQIAGVFDRPVNPPKWTVPRPSSKRRSSTGLLHVSDLHVGEVIERNAVGGYNAYDPDIFVARFRRMISAAIPITQRWSRDTRVEGFVLALNGDLISGDIHEELRNTNALTAQKQVELASDEIIAGIHQLVEAFGSVLVTCTPGNNGRTTLKPPSKKIAELSYDMMVGSILAREFRNDPRVTVQLAAGQDLTFKLLGWNIFQSHGDHMGTGGGKGFAGPDLPIVRGGRLTMLNAFAQGLHYDIILTGHYHTTSNPGRTLANGSVVGYSEYSQSIRAMPEPPQQWLALIHERWGLRERIPLVLDEAPRFGATK